MLDPNQNLPDKPAELKQLIDALSSQVKSQALLIEKLKHQLLGMKQHRFGASSEALDQLLLSLEDAGLVTAETRAVDHETASGQKVKKQPGRKPLPDRLPRHDHILSPGESCGHCDGTLKTLGRNVTEELEYVPGRIADHKINRIEKLAPWHYCQQQTPMEIAA